MSAEPVTMAVRPAPSAGAPAPAAEAILARAAGENFPVAPRWIPRPLRDDLVAIYGFARLADTLGDEAPGDRLEQLDALEADLDRAAAGGARHPLVQRLAPALRAGRLPDAPLRRLIEANRLDQRQRAVPTWAALCDYCALSANPVGELVLHAAGLATPARIALSDSVCTALQVVEHCQDAAEDRAAGRSYLPEDDMRRYGVVAADLAARPAPPALRSLIRFEVLRVRALLRDAVPLVASLRGAVRLAVAGYAAGGHAAADALERVDFDPSAGAPRTRRRDILRHAITILWRARSAKRQLA